jgi:hypothetical protein
MGATSAKEYPPAIPDDGTDPAVVKATVRVTLPGTSALARGGARLRTVDRRQRARVCTSRCSSRTSGRPGRMGKRWLVARRSSCAAPDRNTNDLDFFSADKVVALFDRAAARDLKVVAAPRSTSAGRSCRAREREGRRLQR